MFTIVKRPAPAKKSKGYDVYHTNSTRKLWVGEAHTKREADAIVAKGLVPSRVKGRKVKV